jgi:hypothetical protein
MLIIMRCDRQKDKPESFSKKERSVFSLEPVYFNFSPDSGGQNRLPATKYFASKDMFRSTQFLIN